MAAPPTTTAGRAHGSRAGAAVRRAPFSENPVGARGPAHPAANPRRGAAGLRRRGLPPRQHRPDREAQRVLSGVLLPVLRQQGGPVPAARGAGGAPGERVDRGARIRSPPTRRLVRAARVGRSLRRDPRAVRAGLRRATRPTTSSPRSPPTTGDEVITRIHARLVATTLPSRQLDPVIRLLLECLNHTLGVAGVLRSAAPDAYPRDRVGDAVTDVLHRTLFGARPA